MRKLLSLFLLLGCVLCAQASTPVTRSWGKLWDLRNGDSDSSDAMTVDANGNIYVFGDSQTLGSFWLTVQKLDPYGNILWTSPLPFLYNAGASCICTDGNGNVYVAGDFYTYAHSSEIFVAKINSNGTGNWMVSYGGPGALIDTAEAIDIDSNGHVLVGGSKGVGTSGNVLLLEYTAAGGFVDAVEDATIRPANALFTKDHSLLAVGPKNSPGGQYGGAGFVCLDSAGNKILSESPDNTSATTYDYMPATDSAGNFIIGTKRLTNFVHYYSIRSFSPTGALKTVVFETTGDLYWLSASDPDYIFASVFDSNSYIRAYDSSGGLHWATPLLANYVTADRSNGVVGTRVAGNPQTITLTKIDSTGAVAWTQSYIPANSGSAFAYGSNVQFSNGVLYIFGSASGPVSSDLLLLKYTQGTAISAMGLASNSVNGGSTIQGSVSINSPAPAGGFAVQLISSLPGVLGVNPSLIIPEGATFAKFTAKTNIVDATYSAVVYARAAGVTRFASTLVNPAILADLTVPGSTVKGGTPVTATVTLSGVTGPSGRNVALSSTDTTAATVPSLVYIPSGKKTATFTITTKSVVGANKTPTINAKLAGVTKSVALTVTP